VGRRHDQDDQTRRGAAASARVEDELREARDEVFRAYVRAREQALRLGEDPGSGGRPQHPAPSRDQEA
jgi:hypothetical protein